MYSKEEARTAREVEILTMEAGTYADMRVCDAIGWFVEIVPAYELDKLSGYAIRTGSREVTQFEIYGTSRPGFNPSTRTDDALSAIASPCFGNFVFDSILCPYGEPTGGNAIGASVRMRYALTPPAECPTPYVWAPSLALAIARCILLNKERSPYYRQAEIEQAQRARFVMTRRPMASEIQRCAPGWTRIEVRSAWAGFYAVGVPPEGGSPRDVPEALWRASFHA